MGGEQGPGPGEHAFTGLCEPFEALAPGNQFQAQLILQITQTHRQGRLGDVAARSRLAEVSGLLQRDEEFKLLDIH